MTNSSYKIVTGLVVFIFAFGLVGCSSYRTIQTDDRGVLHAIAVGDKVKIKTYEGVRHEFQVTKVNQDSIVGNDIEIKAEEIASIEKMEFDAELTTAAAGTTAVVGYMVYVTIAVFAGLAALAAL